LLKNKTRPRECVEEVPEWIVQERETREKLKKEKAEVYFHLADIPLLIAYNELDKYSVRPRRRKRLKKRRRKRYRTHSYRRDQADRLGI
jgi:hypothetical protein